MGYVSLIVKATRLCNLRCTYCYDWRDGPDQTMPFPVLARMTSAVLADPEHDAVDFIWHGGETTVLPIAFYEKALLVQSRFRRSGQRITNYLQTNGTRITPEWAHFFRANQFVVGVSLDGPPEIHDRYRRYASGRASFDRVLRGIHQLQEQRVPFGVIMVIDEGALAMGPDRIFDFFLEHGINDYGFCSVKPTNQPHALPGTPTEHYATPAQMNAFLSRLYDRWREHGDRSIRIRELDGVHRRLSGKLAMVCTLAGGCLGHYYVIEPNGEVAHCDLFLGDPRYTLGNVMTEDFATIRRGARLLTLQQENEQALAGMRSCPEFGICNGWCPHNRYVSVRHNPDHRADCCGLRELIGHVRSRIAEDAPAPLAPAAV